MKKILVVFILSVSCLFLASDCYAEISYYKSSLSGYVKVESSNKLSISEKKGDIIVTLSHDATFTADKEVKAIEAVGFQLENTDKDWILTKKDKFYLVFQGEEIPLDRFFKKISSGTNIIYFDLKKRGFKGLIEKNNVGWQLLIKDGNELIYVDLPEQVLDEWREVLNCNMYELQNKEI